jgi:hypothetical protein
MAPFRAAQPQADHTPVHGTGRPPDDLVAGLGVVADDVEHPAKIDAQAGVGALAPVIQRGQDLIEGQARVGYVGVWGKGDFRVPHVLAGHLGAELVRDEAEIVYRPQTVRDSKIDPEKVVETGELIEGSQSIQILGREPDAIPLG